MATTILFVFSLCVLCCEVLSVPVLKLKSVDSDDTVERTIDVTKKVLKLDKVSELVQSFEVPLTSASSSDMDSVKSLSRVKRQVIVYHGCPDGTIWFAKQCLSFEKYERLLKEEEEE